MNKPVQSIEAETELNPPCTHDDIPECGHCIDCGEYVGTGLPEWENNDDR